MTSVKAKRPHDEQEIGYPAFRRDEDKDALRIAVAREKDAL